MSEEDECEPNPNQDLLELLDTIEMLAEDTSTVVTLKRCTKPEYEFKLTWNNAKYEAKTLQELICFMDGIMNGYHIKGKHIEEGH